MLVKGATDWPSIHIHCKTWYSGELGPSHTKRKTVTVRLEKLNLRIRQVAYVYSLMFVDTNIHAHQNSFMFADAWLVCI